MAKGKRKPSFKTTLRYEVYGILILIFSIITLAKEGNVGASLRKMSRFAVGHLDFVIPLVFIGVGLYVMIKRAWPRKWTVRHTGAAVMLLSLTVFYHVSLFQQMYPDGAFKSSAILTETWSMLFEGLLSQDPLTNILTAHVGGGVAGSLLYGVLYFLFGGLGTSLVMYTGLVIGFILVTNFSFVDAVRRLNRSFKAMNALLEKKAAGGAGKPAARTKKPKPEAIPVEEEIHEENYNPSLRDKPKRKAVFFDLIKQTFRKPDKEAESDDDEPLLTDERDEPAASAAMSQPAQSNLPETTPSAEWQADGPEMPGDSQKPAGSPEEEFPRIRDFQESYEESSFTESVPDETLSESEALITEQSLDEEKQREADGLAPPVKPKPVKPYQLPSFHLLAKPAHSGKGSDGIDYTANARKLAATLESFGVRAKVLEVVRGPSVTRYEIQPDVGVKVSSIVRLTDDIALAMAAKDIRMEAPIPGKSAIGIEVPNPEVSMVTLREVMETSTFHESSSRLTIGLGRDISGQPIVANLARMPHLLVAGATGSGKSVCINGIITSILFKAKPDEVKFLMIDPKMVELNVYNGIPHLLAPVVTDPRRASLALKKVVVEMEKRYELFSKSGTRNIEGYNTMLLEKGAGQESLLPFIVVIVDELADLMMVAAGDVEDAICRLAQMARAAGIHLIIATQRPSVDVITGVIKANIPSRIAFGVSSQVDSRTILDMVGAEKLLGRGDMLFMPVGASKPLRVQGAFLSDQEVEAVVQFCSTQEQAVYQPELVPEAEEKLGESEEFEDELYDQAVQIVVDAKQASVSLLQRRMRIGYTRAARLIDSMEAKGVVGPYEGSKPREVTLTPEQLQQSKISS